MKAGFNAKGRVASPRRPRTARRAVPTLLVLFLLLCLRCGAQTNTNTVTLAWNYPAALAAADSNLTFVISYTTNLNYAPWAGLTNVLASSETNQAPGGPNYYSVRFLIVPGQYFFTCQASNFWGVGSSLSLQSNYAWTPPAPIPTTNLSISRP